MSQQMLFIMSPAASMNDFYSTSPRNIIWHTIISTWLLINILKCYLQMKNANEKQLRYTGIIKCLVRRICFIMDNPFTSPPEHCSQYVANIYDKFKAICPITRSRKCTHVRVTCYIPYGSWCAVMQLGCSSVSYALPPQLI